MISVRLPAKQLIVYGAPHTDGKLYGRNCITLNAEQMTNGIPLSIQFDYPIGRAFPYLKDDGIDFEFDFSDPYKALAFFHRSPEYQRRIGLKTPFEWGWVDDVPTILHAEIFEVTLWSCTLEQRQHLRAVNA